MDYGFTKEQNQLREKTQAFVEKEISMDVARTVEKEDDFPHELMRKLSEQGFMALNVPKKYGGYGGNVIDEMIFFEELSKKLPVLAWTAGDIILYGNNIIKTNGNEKQKSAYLPKLAKGELIFCFALTEADAGSDAANIQTSAEYKDDHYMINGSKMFISGAGVADISVTNTRTASSKYKGITSFLVDCRSEGYSTSPIKKLGYKGSNTCEVYYKDVKVAPENILGGEKCLNQGWYQMMKLLNGERLVLSACALGIGHAVLSKTIQFVNEKLLPGRQAGMYQDIEHSLADMATQLEAARRLAYHAGAMVVDKIDCVKETSMSKYFCAETGKKIAKTGVEILGRYGVTMESDVQRFFRDVLILSIGGGTTQIQKNIVSKFLI